MMISEDGGRSLKERCVCVHMCVCMYTYSFIYVRMFVFSNLLTNVVCIPMHVYYT